MTNEQKAAMLMAEELVKDAGTAEMEITLQNFTFRGKNYGAVRVTAKLLDPTKQD